MKILNIARLDIEHRFYVENLNFAEASIPISSVETSAGGKGINISLALSRAGASKLFNAGIIGSDGELISKTLTDSGVNISNIKVVNGKSGYSLLFLNDKNAKRFSYSGTNHKFTEKFVASLLQRFSSHDFLILDDSVEIYKYIIDLANKKGMTVFFCPDKSPTDFENCEFLFLNIAQARKVSGFTNREDFVRFFKTNYPFLKVIINLGDNGYLYIDKTQEHFQAAFKKENFGKNTNFETFVGYFIASLATDKKLQEAMRFSAAASAVGSVVPYEFEVIEAIKNLEECESEENNRTLWLNKRVNEYIEDNIKTAKIKGLSAFLGYSEVYTGELIKNTLGISFSQLLQQKRCELAAKMLLGTRFSVKEIINMVGYDNETFFRKKFKNFYGVSPNQYRKNG